MTAFGQSRGLKEQENGVWFTPSRQVRRTTSALRHKDKWENIDA